MTDEPSIRGAVVIGRNEGERLRISLQSIKRDFERVVYVDSDSNDGSVELARSFDVPVVELDRRQPLTAARARNAGAAELLRLFPSTDFIQFIDGDCEIESSWLGTGLSHLRSHSDVAAVCGRRRERYPRASLFNRLCDLEWDTPIGDVQSCGGDVLMRTTAFQQVGGFKPTLIAGEEPDLCFRLRQAGWRIVRLDAAMTIHDAAIFHLRQWWQRAKRSGYADMEANACRGRSEPHLRRRVMSNFVWSLPPAWPLWPVLWLRCYTRRGALYATHIVAGKLPHAIGQFEYWRRSRRSGAPTLIEYK
ncbi:glycosyltransferase family 2 protein [Sphingomonas hankyongi]|uniref:Glycosyltransferase n=1 Tax=Sphingomonas hankyongi TaxID=2908209 RepID=A0ABT0S3C1_9SPHN|nr:glycosyltransferase [Sphingomonas hankyongi]MCL6730129.1 glycosyltransferase [Sphingomonas hankyongi]